MRLGSSEFCLDFNNFIFLFENEQNKETFKKNPKKYLKERPKISNELNINIIGPPSIGLEEYAKRITQDYNLKLITSEEFFENYLNSDTIINSENDFDQFLEYNKKSLRESLLNGQ